MDITVKHKYDSLLQTLRLMENQVGSLCDHFREIEECKDQGCFIPAALIQQILDTAQAYIAHDQTLSRFLEDCMLEGERCISVIHAALDQYRASHDTALFREIIDSYFRLTTTAQKVEEMLEQSKEMLQNTCKLPASGLADALRPYAMIADAVRQRIAPLEEAELDELYRVLPESLHKFVRYLEKNWSSFSIDATADISRYYDHSCALLTPVQVKGEAEAVPSDTEAPATDASAHAKEPEPPIENSPTPQQEVLRDEAEGLLSCDAPGTEADAMQTGMCRHPELLFEDYAGYCIDVQIKTTDKTNPADFSVKKFLSDIKMLHRSSLSAMRIVQNAGYLNAQALRLALPQMDFDVAFDLLLKRGYLCRARFQAGAVSLEGVSVSAKGAEAFERDMVKEKYKHPVLPSCLKGLSAKPQPTVATAVRFQEILTYLIDRISRGDRSVPHLYTSNAPGMVSAVCSKGEETYGVFSGTLFPGEEKAYLDAVRQHLLNPKIRRLLILVAERSDIPSLMGYWDLDGESAKRVFFAHRERSGDLLDGQGNPVPDEVFEGATEAAFSEPEPEDGQDALLEELSVEWDGTENEEDAESAASPVAGEAQSTETEPPETTIPENLPARPAIAKPGRSAEFEPSDVLHTEDIALYDGIADKALSGDQAYAGLLMLNALQDHAPSLKSKYLKFAYAMDDPALDAKYLCSHLLEVYPETQGTDLANDALMLGSFFRMFFTQDIQLEPYSVDANLLAGNLLYERISILKRAAFVLVESFKRVLRGFDGLLLISLIDGDNIRSKIEDVRRQARTLIDAKYEACNVENGWLKNTRGALFGRGSMLRKLLDIVAEDRVGEATFVEQQLQEFRMDGVGGEGSSFSNLAIERRVDAQWQNEIAKGSRQRRETLKPTSKSTIVNRIREILDVAANWAQLRLKSPAGGTINEQELSFLRGKREELIRLLDDVQPALVALKTETALEKAAVHVLHQTIGEIRRCLESGRDMTFRKYFYINLLRTNHVELNQDHRPNLERGWRPIVPFGLCERIAEHIATPLPSWEDALRRIFEPSSEMQGHDYGSARFISAYLAFAQPGFTWPGTYDISKNLRTAASRLDAQERSFAAQLEMAEHYGWIEDEMELARLRQAMEKMHIHYQENENHGFYYRAISTCLNRVQKDALVHREKYVERLHRLLSARGASPLLTEVEHLIGKQMYTVAQDYMDRAEKDGQQAPPPNYFLSDAGSHFKKFVTSYGDLFASTRNSQKSNFAEDFKRRHRGENNTRISTGIAMLENWPLSESGVILTKLKKLFDNIGLPVERVDRKEGNNHFSLTFLKGDDKINYNHPIAAFGSGMIEDGLDVFTVYGSKDATQMNIEICKTITVSTCKSALFIADTALQLPERRRLAETIKRENLNTIPYVILDRVLILYLASQPKSERWDALLRCALPFQYLNPYVESNVEIAPEMFIGRKMELESVVNVGGVNLIYGGRQLGKTALLHRAKAQEDQRSVGKWSVYMDIKHDDYRQAALSIYQRLQTESFLEGPEKSEISWSELSRLIVLRINRQDRPVSKFLLLMDEADRFLKSCEQVNYEPIDCLKRIQTDTSNHFKFVLAGLHNVLRFNHKALMANSVLPQLSAKTIKPLPFREARDLLERPLSYLGFSMYEDQVSLVALILSNANYYPGLIQFYASRLVKSLRTDSYDGEADAPPYRFNEKRILNILKGEDFSSEIRNKFLMTIGIDADEGGYYAALVYGLAYCNYHDEEQSINGFTAGDIRSACVESLNHSIESLDEGQVRELLYELEELNILRNLAADGGEPRFSFNRPSFRHMLGSERDVDDKMLDLADSMTQRVMQDE